MRYEIKTGPQGHIYLPKQVREALGPDLVLFPNAAAAVLAPVGMSYEDILKSLEIIKADLEHKLSMSKKTKD
jgi:hypothetical protein